MNDDTSHLSKDPQGIFGIDGSWMEVRTMPEEDVSVAPPVKEVSKPNLVLGFLTRQAQKFVQDPLSFALDGFFYCLLLGIAIPILVWGIRFVVSAVVSSVS